MSLLRYIIVILGLALLIVIFVRRYMIVEKGISRFRLFGMGKRQKILQHFHHLFEREQDFAVTVDELIPGAETVEPMKVAKADAIFRKADVFFENRDVKNAGKLFIQSLSLDPSRAEAYHKLGLIYLKEGQFGKAEMIYRKLIANFPSEPMYFSNLGLALYQQQKLADAKTFYVQAIELDGTRPGRFFSLAQILHQLQEPEAALVNYQKALEFEPHNVDYLLTLARFYLDTGVKEEAQKILEQILAKYPRNAIALEMKRESLS